MKNISKDAFLKLPIVIPPLPEQKNIAAILSTWDAAIQALQELIAAKEQQQKGLMQRLLTGEVRFGEFVKEDGKKDTALGKIPKDWTLLKADEIFESVSIKNNKDEPLLAVTQENGVIPRDMLEGRVMMPSGDTNSYKLAVPGNFVISLRSFQGGIEYSEYRGIVSPAYTVINHKIPIVKSFFRHFFKSTEFIGRLSIAVIGIRDGKQISFKDFSAMKFRFPSLEEQERITTVLNEGEEEISVLNQKLDTLKTQKKGLMQRLLTGEVRTI
ncbi:MAG: restriction endonuclease subunit S [Phaeodactylibacter sp.]|nr:restriction endonuclease subunit S [Phaeodactylibacter sp.]